LLRISCRLQHPGWRPLSLTALVAVAAMSSIVSAQAARLRLVSTAWAPFTNEPGKPRFALDLVEAAMGRIGVTASTTIVDANQFTTSLLGGRFDGSAAAWKDAERERLLLFSQPYLENRLILVGRRGSDVSATTLSALKGKRIALVEGYSYGAEVEKAGPVIVASRTEEDSLTQLLSGRVDYTLMDDIVVQYILNAYEEQARAKLQVGSSPLLTRPLYLAVRRDRPDAKSIIERFNGQLRGLIADGTYHRLLHVDWIRADVDGDGVAEFVPRSERSGPQEPQRAYSFTTIPPEELNKLTQPQPRGNEPRFYFGGTVYQGWQTVPERYKAPDYTQPETVRPSGSIFSFSW
jgi:polar amino acid transport system substrate-binding protein